MNKIAREMFLQADYDIKTAEHMFTTGRYIYSIFMCHLTLEKLLKAIYCLVKKELPPKTHSLDYLLSKTQLETPSQYHNFIKSIAKLSVPTRYPEDLNKLLQKYNQTSTKYIINMTKEIYEWLKDKFK